MHNKYDLGKFMDNETKKNGIVDFGSFQVSIKEDAWTFLSLQKLFVEHEKDPLKLTMGILDLTLSPEDKQKIENSNLSVQGKERLIMVIVGHIFGLKVDDDNIAETIKKIQLKSLTKKKPSR